MEGAQQRESEPANRLHVQVLDISCFHRASLESTSVQGPERRLNMDAKSFFISQRCYLHKPMYFISLVTPFWHTASFHSPSINGRSNRDLFSSGFAGLGPLHIWSTLEFKMKLLVIAFKAFHLCNLIPHRTLL